MPSIEINNISDLENPSVNFGDRGDPLIVTTVLQLLKCEGTGIQCQDFSKLFNQDSIAIKVASRDVYSELTYNVNETHDVQELWPDLNKLNVASLVLAQLEVTKINGSTPEHQLAFNATMIQLLEPENTDILSSLSDTLKQKVVSLIDNIENKDPKPNNWDSLIPLRTAALSSVASNKENVSNQHMSPPPPTQRSQSASTAPLQILPQQTQPHVSMNNELVVKKEPDDLNPMFIPPVHNDSQFPNVEHAQAVPGNYQINNNQIEHATQQHGSYMYSQQSQQRQQQQQQQQQEPMPVSQNYHIPSQPQQQFHYQQEIYQPQLQAPLQGQLAANTQAQGYAVTNNNSPYQTQFQTQNSLPQQQQQPQQSPAVQQQVLVPSPANIAAAQISVNNNNIHFNGQQQEQLQQQLPILQYQQQQQQPQPSQLHQSPLTHQPQQLQVVNGNTQVHTPSPMTPEQIEKARIAKEKRLYFIRDAFASQEFQEGDEFDIKGYIIATESPEFSIIGEGISGEISVNDWGLYITNIPPADRLEYEDFILIPNVNCLYLRFTDVKDITHFFGYRDDDVERLARTEEYNSLQGTLNTLTSSSDSMVLLTMCRKRIDLGVGSMFVWKMISTANELIEQMRK